jgi:hypothetical protein
MLPTKSVKSNPDYKANKYSDPIVFNKTDVVYNTYTSLNQRIIHDLHDLEDWGEICGFFGGSDFINGDPDDMVSQSVGYLQYWPILRCLLLWGVNADTHPNDDDETSKCDESTFKIVGSDTMT